MTSNEQILINEIEQLILHAEEGDLTYSVLEHARKLVFEITSKEGSNKPLETLLESESERLRLRTIERDAAKKEILRLREVIEDEKLGEMTHLKESHSER